LYDRKKQEEKLRSTSVVDTCHMLCLVIINPKETLENTEGAIKNEQSRETDNIGYTRHKTNANKTKTQHNRCWTPL